MRFLMLNWRDPKNPRAGGAERVTHAFLRGLVARGHEAWWYAYDFAGATQAEEIDGVRVVRGGRHFGAIRQARAWYRRQARFDLVIDQHHGIPWYAPWWCRTACIAYIHEVLGPIWRCFYRWPTSELGRMQETITHWLYRRVPFWVPSESTRQALLRRGVQRVTVLPNGVDTAPLPVLPAKPMSLPVRLIVVSRLAPNKRIDHCLQAIPLLQRRGIDAQLEVVGGGEDELRLRKLAASLGVAPAVTFLGAQPEIEKNRRLERAHLLWHASVREGWGLNVIEANALGTPAVVYPVDGLRDSTIDGETGLHAREESPAALAEATAALVKDPAAYERCRRQAWARSRQFQWDAVLPRVCAWLEQQASAGNKKGP